MKNLFKKYWPLLIILSSVGFLFSFRLGRDLLWDWDECIYAGYAVSMKLHNNFLHNTWNGLNLFEKSPFYSWILQLPQLFGKTEFNLRLPTILASLTLLGSVYVFCQNYLSKKTAVLASLLLLTLEAYVIYSTKVSTDIIFSLFIFLAFWSWVSSKKIFATGLFFAFALMIKGLGVAPYIATLFLTTLIQPKKSHFTDFIKMLCVFLAIGLPWHLLMYVTHQKEFIQMYLVDNFYKRSTFPVEFHRERLWFYAEQLYKEAFPWLLGMVVFPLLNLKNLLNLRKHHLVYTVLLFVIIPFISISRVQTRIAWYVIPLLPFLAIYLAYCMNLLIDFLSKKFPKKYRFVILHTLYGLLLLFVAYDAGKLILNETRLFEEKQKIDPRYEVVLQTSKQPSNTLNYLVPFGERQAKEILPPDETLTNTWYYGGNACAVYYSNKKVNYFYEIGDFEKTLNKGTGLFLISNQDSKYTEGKKTIFKNSEFTLFTF